MESQDQIILLIIELLPLLYFTPFIIEIWIDEKKQWHGSLRLMFKARAIENLLTMAISEKDTVSCSVGLFH